MGHVKGNKKRFFYSFLCILFSILIVEVSVPSSTSALTDLQKTIFKENNIMFWNPDEDPCNDYGDNYIGVSAIDNLELLSDNGSTIFNYLTQLGYSASSAAAIMGNLENENGALNPRVLEGGKVVGEDFVAFKNGSKTFSGGFGIAQWTSSGRVQRLQEFADSLRQPVTSLSVQTKFLAKELSDYGITPASLNSQGFKEATTTILRGYERPADQSDAVVDKRAKSGEKYLSMPPSDAIFNDEDVAIICVPGTSVGANGIPKDTGISLEDGIAFSQCDPIWGGLAYGSSTLCKSGCGPTSFAMIASFLTGKNITPADAVSAANKYGLYQKGVGSSWAISEKLANEYGLKHTHISPSGDIINSINSYLKNGYMIHTSGQGGSPYSSGGHYIAIVGTTSDGKWKVANSAGKGSIKAYSPQEVIRGMKTANIHAIGK